MVKLESGAQLATKYQGTSANLDHWVPQGLVGVESEKEHLGEQMSNGTWVRFW